MIRCLLTAVLVQAATPPPTPRRWIVEQTNANATDKGPGDAETPFRTISAAAAVAKPGDDVVVGNGIYRERVSPARGGTPGNPITYMAASGTHPTIRGSKEVPPTSWTAVNNDDATTTPTTFQLKIDTAWFEEIDGGIFNPYAIRLGWPGNESVLPPYGGCCKLGWSLGQLFQNGKILTELPPIAVNKSNPLPPNSWMTIGNGTAIVARFNGSEVPDQHGQPHGVVEMTVRKNVFAPVLRGLGWITVRGFQMEHAATQWDDAFWVPRRQPYNPSRAAFAQSGLLSPRSGHCWRIENNTLQHSKTIALDIGDEGGYDPEGNQPTPSYVGNHTVQFNRLVNNGGKAITGSFGSVGGPEPVRHQNQQKLEHQQHLRQRQHQQYQQGDGGKEDESLQLLQGKDQISALPHVYGDQPCPECSVHKNHGGHIAFNIIAGNNYLSCHAAENAALKTHGFSGTVVGNLIIDNYQSVGMWFDDLWYDVRVSRNIIVGHRDNDWGGIMLEISTGPALIDNNFIFTSGAAGGIAEQDSNNATVVQNLVMNKNGSYPSSDLNGNYTALTMGGTWRRHYNCRDMEGCPYHSPTGGDQPWSWLSWGCGLAPTNATTNKNYHVAGNILLGPEGQDAITVECKYNNTDNHVCCNNTIDRNAISVPPNTPATKHGDNIPTVITLELVGDTDHRDWTFETQLKLRITSDDGQ